MMVEQERGQYAQLRVRSGPLAGQAYVLDRTNIVIGREKGCNIRPDQYEEVSRRHARILWNQGFCIEDLGSRNRTTVGGVPLTGTRHLQDKDVITLGDFSVEFLLPANRVLTAPAKVDERDTMPQKGRLPVPALAMAVMGVVALGIFGSLSGSGTQSVHAASSPSQTTTKPPSESEEAPTDSKKAPEDQAPQGQSPPVGNGTELSASALEQTKDSTILIVAKHPGREEYSQGSGFCALQPNLVVTNAHVVLTADAQPSRALLVLVLRSGQKGQQKAVKGEIVAVDTQNDLALVRISGDNKLHPLPLGDPSDLKETEVCFAFGFPGVRQISSGPPEVSVQRVSVESLRRDDTGALARIQLGGTITHGNSGGPIVDAQGHVVGVVREAARTAEGVRNDPQQAAGISYAIPVTRLSVMLQEIKEQSGQSADDSTTGSKAER